MYRRDVLGLAGASLAISLAGCSEDDGPADPSNNSTTEEAENQPTGSETVSSDVQIVAGYPVETDDGTELETEVLLTAEDFVSVQSAEQGSNSGTPFVPVQLTQAGAEKYVDRMVETGFTSDGVGQCTFDAEEDDEPKAGEYCLYTVLDGEYVYGASMSQGLANTLNNNRESFIENPSFVMNTQTYEEAQQLEAALTES